MKKGYCKHQIPKEVCEFCREERVRKKKNLIGGKYIEVTGLDGKEYLVESKKDRK